MKKNGFTLIELLAVIVILGLLATVAVPSAINISNSIKENLYCDKIDMLLNDAKRWGEDHLSTLKTDCYREVTVKYLVEEGFTKREENADGTYISNPVTGYGMDANVIGVYRKNRRAYAFYIESDASLSGVCEELVVEDRPTTKC